MAIQKKLTFGSVSALVALVLALVGAVAYYVNICSVGYFEGAAVASAAVWLWLSILALAVVVVLALPDVSGVLGKAVEIVSGALRIAAPTGLIAGAMLLVKSRAQGLAFIYFSNEEVLAEVQTAANLSSATWAIVTIAVLAVAGIVGIVSAFFRMKK